jgi:hypothetical protein
MRIGKKPGMMVVLALGMMWLLQGCAASRSNCDCNDLSKNYKAPKSYKKNVY